MIVTTEAIVLRARKHGETSKIVTLYTRDFGMLNVIAKGAREMKSKFGGALEMFARTSAVFYKKEKTGDQLYLLSKAELVESNSKILSSLDRIEAATAIIELLLRSMHDEEENREVYELLAATMRALSSAASDASADSIRFRFYLEFARIVGFELKLRDDDPPLGFDERRFKTETLFQLSTGEMKEYVVDASDPEHVPMFKGIKLMPESRAALLYLESSSLDKAGSLRISERAVTQLADLFQAFFAEHLSGITSRSMKSGRVFGAL